jgi:molybdenum cofactor cytidylyltransferase
LIRLEEVAAVLLCAGLSKRYGPENKLLALLDGKPLAGYTAALCESVPFAARIAVVPATEPTLHTLLLNFGFDLIVNPRPEMGKDSSLRLGLAAALRLGVGGALVLLGDMPHVTNVHLRALSAAADDTTTAISAAGTTLSPPTLMPAGVVGEVLARADRPVRASLGSLAHVAAPNSMLADYDRPEQFNRIHRSLRYSPTVISRRP